MRYVIAGVAILVLLGVLGGLKGAQIGKLIAFGKQAQESGPPPETVSDTHAEQQSWQETIDAVGTVASGKGVALSTDVSGVVTRISFESGQTVKQGQVLVELDSSVERAQLASLAARKDLANTTLGRTKALADKGAISPAALDADQAALKTASTDVDGLYALIAKKTIRAPYAGKLGIRAVNVGQFLNPGTPVTVLETADALHVDFTLPQQRLGEVKVGMPVEIAIEGVKGDPMMGAIAAVDPDVDASSRAIKLRADLAAKDDRLRPGMFVTVKVEKAEKITKVVVPQTAVVHASYGDSVFVIEDKKPEDTGTRTTPDGKTVKVARQQFVRLGPARGDFVMINDGLKAGDDVVTAGAFKLRNKAPIVIDNSKALKPELDPHPENR